MTTRLERSLDFAAPAAALHAAYTDKQYWEQRIGEVGGEGARVAELTVSDAADSVGRSVQVLVVHQIPEDRLPSVVTAIRPGGLEIHRREEWGPLTDGRSEGKFSATIDGVPAQLSGTATMIGGGADAADSTTITARGEANVSIPFIASKVESLVIENLQELMEQEREFTLQWIAART